MRARSNVASCNHEGEAVILNMTTGLYHGLNEVGSRIWTLVQEPTPVSVLRDSIVEEYDVDPVRCITDLLSVLEDMRAAELIEVCGDEESGD